MPARSSTVSSTTARRSTSRSRPSRRTGRSPACPQSTGLSCGWACGRSSTTTRCPQPSPSTRRSTSPRSSRQTTPDRSCTACSRASRAPPDGPSGRRDVRRSCEDETVSPPFVDPETIRRRARDGGFERGVAYFRDGAVIGVRWDPAGSTLSGDVRGSAGRTYHSEVGVAIAPAGVQIRWTTCACPLGGDCKHTVALLLAGNASLAHRPAPKKPAPAPWRALLSPPPARTDQPALAPGFELRQLAPRGGGGWAPPRAKDGTRRSP